MSILSGIGAIFSGVAEGVQSLWGYLSQFFRWPGGAVQESGQAQPGRERLPSAEEAIQRARERHLIPEDQPAPLRFSAKFLCTITNTDTNDSITKVHFVDYDQGELSRSGLYSRAYRYMRSQIERYFPGEDSTSPNFKISCKLLSNEQITSVT